MLWGATFGRAIKERAIEQKENIRWVERKRQNGKGGKEPAEKKRRQEHEPYPELSAEVEAVFAKFETVCAALRAAEYI